MQKLDIDDEPGKEQLRLLQQVNKCVFEAVSVATLKKLPMEMRVRFNSMRGDGNVSDMEIYVFAQKNISNYDIYVERVVADYFKEMNDFKDWSKN